jgi:hypothetical protein
MESWRNPAVAVSISTRTGGMDGGVVVVVVEDGVDGEGEPGCEHAAVRATSSSSPALTSPVYVGRPFGAP